MPNKAPEPTLRSVTPHAAHESRHSRRGSSLTLGMKGRCYLCGCPNPATRDHVPPAGFFPSPRPPNLITVPCCESCNVGYSVDDDYLRLVMSSLVGRSPAGDRIWAEKVVPRTLKRLPREIDAIRRSLEDVILQTENGPVEATSFQFEVGRLERYAVRITKGLLAHHFPAYDYFASSFDVRFIPLTHDNLEFLAPYRDVLTFEEKGDRVFRYRYGLSDTEKSGLWMLTFYDAILIMVHHALPGKAQQGARANDPTCHASC